MVEVEYTADLKSAPYQWVVGSSPAARTTCISLKISLRSIHSSNFPFSKGAQGSQPLGFLLCR